MLQLPGELPAALAASLLRLCEELDGWKQQMQEHLWQWLPAVPQQIEGCQAIHSPALKASIYVCPHDRDYCTCGMHHQHRKSGFAAKGDRRVAVPEGRSIPVVMLSQYGKKVLKLENRALRSDHVPEQAGQGVIFAC